jgi:hypothetical protein
MGWDKRRKRMRNLVLGADGLLMIPVLPLAYNTLAHARVDSEVGVMVNGVPMIGMLLLATPFLAACTAFWAQGFVRSQTRGLTIPRWEPWLLAGNLMAWGGMGFVAAPLYWRALRNAIA